MSSRTLLVSWQHGVTPSVDLNKLKTTNNTLTDCTTFLLSTKSPHIPLRGKLVNLGRGRECFAGLSTLLVHGWHADKQLCIAGQGAG